MMEAMKAQRRRLAEDGAMNTPVFDRWWHNIFSGHGADIGSGDDPFDISPWLHCQSCTHFNLPDGGGDSVNKFLGRIPLFDFLVSSQVLEHALDPVVMLKSWIALLKPGGHIVATVPDYSLYEHARFPSQYNAGHKSTWSLDAFHLPPKGSVHCKLPEWLNQFQAEILLCRLVDTNYNYHLVDIDQTLRAEDNVEAFIEFVLRKP